MAKITFKKWFEILHENWYIEVFKGVVNVARLPFAHCKYIHEFLYSYGDACGMVFFIYLQKDGHTQTDITLQPSNINGQTFYADSESLHTGLLSM